MEGHPYVQGDVLHEGPLLMEGIFQAHVCGLRVPTRHHGRGGHQIPPDFHIPPPKLVLRQIRPHEAPDVASARHDMKSISPEEGLRPQEVLGRHDQDALGRLQEVA